MVASTVGKLSALLAADLSDEQAQRTGLDTLAAARGERRPDAVLLPSRLRLRGSSASPARYLSPRWSITGIQSPRPRQVAPPASMRCASIICARCWRSSRTALITCSGIRWAARQPGDCRPLAPARRSGGLPRPAGYTAAGDAKLERGQRAGSRYWRGSTASAKRSSPPSEASLRRAVQRHRRQLCRCGAAVSNHRAHGAKFDGKATLFVAETRQEGMDPQVVWGRGWELEVFSQNCAHVDIISPEAFEAIGPVVREILG